LNDCLENEFLKDEKVCLVASNGRFRIFMGHTDFKNLGGVS
jgi:hypothetical protein